MTIFEVLSYFGDGTFEVPVQPTLSLGGTQLRTGGVLKGSIAGGTITFDDPKPRAVVPGCLATINKIEPLPPDAAMAYGSVPVLGMQKRIIRIEDAA